MENISHLRIFKTRQSPTTGFELCYHVARKQYTVVFHYEKKNKQVYLSYNESYKYMAHYFFTIRISIIRMKVS